MEEIVVADDFKEEQKAFYRPSKDQPKAMFPQ